MDDDVISALVVLVLKAVVWVCVLLAAACWWLIVTAWDVGAGWVRSTAWWQERHLRKATAQAATRIRTVEDATIADMRTRTDKALADLRQQANTLRTQVDGVHR